MVWPEGWLAIDHPSVGVDFEARVRGSIAPGHPLHGIPFHAIGRRDYSCLPHPDGTAGVTEGLFGLGDGTARVAQVVIPGTCRPMERPCPLTFIVANFQEWVRGREFARWLKGLKPSPDVVPKLKKGDRVLMLRHADWRGDCRATIVQEGRPRIVGDGSTRVEYYIAFDEPQFELEDTPDETCTGSPETSVLEDYLRLLDGDVPDV